MLVSFVIFHKGGLILYQHVEEASENSEDSLALSINTWLTEVYLRKNVRKIVHKNQILLDSKSNNSNKGTRMIVEWEETSDLIAIAVYPDLRHEDFPWIRSLLIASIHEYQMFAKASAVTSDDQEYNIAASATPENQILFDNAFKILFKQHRKEFKSASTASHKISNSISSSENKNNKKSGKEKRQWHDGKAKVTEKAMKELDKSKAAGKEDIMKHEEQALAEARAAYLPTDADLEDFDVEDTTQLKDDEDDDDENSTWGKSLQGLFAQMTGQKVLTKRDLDNPLKEMHKLLSSKNVACDIAQQICEKVRESLVGKKLNSMYLIKTAVRQALEQVVNELLLPSAQLNLLRQVVSKRDQASSFFARSKTQRPYVIVVVGINGVGKSTSLAKLAYYLKINGCSPLLAACDTFRSGAVEQLSVHAKCLGLPIFSKGYSKDPSSVAKSAIEQATKNGNDVVLVDTAGRMQNNLPLMKALGKLAAENQPDTIIFVGEALVGNDGVDQVRMFDKAVSFQNKNQKVNSILLTKFDTVSDKVGAALTMTHVTNAPILFVGTGQKYHHLRKLSTNGVIRSLFL